MNIWLIQDGEPLPFIDAGAREMRCCTLAKELAAKGHDVLWWASTFDYSRKKHYFYGPTTLEVSANLRLRLLHGPGYLTNQSLKRYLHQRAIASAFASEAGALTPPDLIVGNIPFPELAEQAVLLGKKWSIPVVVFVEDCWPDIYLSMFPGFLRSAVRLLFRTEFQRIKRVFSLATSIIAVSNTYLSWALNYAGRSKSDKDEMLPLGYPSPIQTENRSPGESILSKLHIPSDQMLVTFVGGFGYSYDLETVVKAAKVLDSLGVKGVQFLLVGDGDQGLALRAMARGLNNLKFSGWLDQGSIHAVLGVSSVAIAAYHERATQTLPYKPFEYMAAGLPIISSLKGELSDLIETEKIGVCYRSGDVDSLVSMIQWLLAHPEARLQMGQRSRRLFNEQFSAEVIYPRAVKHLENIVAAYKGLGEQNAK